MKKWEGGDIFCVKLDAYSLGLLIFRWEKLQTEEEAALGRGKRLRKNVSYNESVAVKSLEISIDVSILISCHRKLCLSASVYLHRSSAIMCST